MLAFLFIFAAVFFSLCYKYYGRFLIETFLLDDKKKRRPPQCMTGLIIVRHTLQFYWGIIFRLSPVPVRLSAPSRLLPCSVGCRPMSGVLSAPLSWADLTMPVL